MVLIPTNPAFSHSNTLVALIMPALWTMPILPKTSLGAPPQLMARAIIFQVMVNGAAVMDPNAQCLLVGTAYLESRSVRVYYLVSAPSPMLSM